MTTEKQYFLHTSGSRGGEGAPPNGCGHMICYAPNALIFHILFARFPCDSFWTYLNRKKGKHAKQWLILQPTTVLMIFYPTHGWPPRNSYGLTAHEWLRKCHRRPSQNCYGFVPASSVTIRRWSVALRIVTVIIRSSPCTSIAIRTNFCTCTFGCTNKYGLYGFSTDLNYHRPVKYMYATDVWFVAERNVHCSASVAVDREYVTLAFKL